MSYPNRTERLTNNHHSHKPKGNLYNKVLQNSVGIPFKSLMYNGDLTKHVPDDCFRADIWEKVICQWEATYYHNFKETNYICACKHDIEHGCPIKNKINGKILSLGSDCIELFGGELKEYYKNIKHVREKINKEELNFNKSKMKNIKNIMNKAYNSDLNEYEIIQNCCELSKDKSNFEKYCRLKYEQLKLKKINFGKHKNQTYQSRSMYLNRLITTRPDFDNKDMENIKIFIILHKDKKYKYIKNRNI